MKLKQLSLAVALAAVAPFAAAHAPNVTPDLVVNISGASAQQGTLGELLKDHCQSGTLDVYLDKPASGSNGSAWRSYFCTMENVAAVPANLRGKKVLFNTRAKGGSAWGVFPVARGWNVEFMNIAWDNDADSANGRNCTDANNDKTWECPVSSSTRSTDALASATGECPTAGTLTGSRATLCAASDAGVSDVEPRMFNSSANMPAGWSPLTVAEMGGLSQESQYGVIFGAAVSNDVATAMINAGRSVVVDGKTYANFTKSELQSMFANVGMKSWYDFNADIAAAVGDGSGSMRVCRRVVGSGTQAAAQAYFLNNPCSLGLDGHLGMVKGTDTTGADYTVVEGSGTGNVVDCLNGVGTPTGQGAVGFLATERQPSASDKWQFVAVDGVAPTVGSAESGLYDYVYEQTMQWRATLAGSKLDAVKFVRQMSGSAATLSKVNGSGKAIFPGVAAIADASNNWQTMHPVLRGTRGGNSCAPMILAPAL